MTGFFHLNPTIVLIILITSFITNFLLNGNGNTSFLSSILSSPLCKKGQARVCHWPKITQQAFMVEQDLGVGSRILFRCSYYYITLTVSLSALQSLVKIIPILSGGHGNVYQSCTFPYHNEVTKSNNDKVTRKGDRSNDCDEEMEWA